MSCLYASASDTVLENLIIIKLRRLKSTRAGACIIQILQELELEPAEPSMDNTDQIGFHIGRKQCPIKFLLYPTHSPLFKLFSSQE